MSRGCTGCLWGIVRRVAVLAATVAIFTLIIRWAWQPATTSAKSWVCAHAPITCERP